MTKLDDYRYALRDLDTWDAYLLAESGLPGPRGNIELANAVADEGDEALFHRYLAYDADTAPTNTPEEFLAFCGALGLGRLIADGRADLVPRLRRLSEDPRWRTREAVAMALQRWGDADMDGLLAEMRTWSGGSALERRAAAAGLCEPRLLRDAGHAAQVLEILDAMTASIAGDEQRRSDAFRALRKGLGYCWSVAVAAAPDAGKPMMESWLDSDDEDVRWIMRQNLAKKRLERIDPEWVASCRDRLA